MFRKIQSSIFSYFFTIVIIALFALVVVVNSILSRFENRAVEKRLEDVTVSISDYINRIAEKKESDGVLLSKTLAERNIDQTKTLYSSFKITKKNSKKWNAFRNENKDSLKDSLQLISQFQLSSVKEDKRKGFDIITSQLEQFQKLTNVEDILLLDEERVLAVAKNKNAIGMSLGSGVFKDQQLERVINRLGTQQFTWIDLSNYSLEEEQKRIFLIVKIPNATKGNYYLLYVYNPINWKVNNQIGTLGKVNTMDIYLVGSDGLVRSNTRKFIENPSSVLLKLSQEGYSDQQLTNSKENNSLIGVLKVGKDIIDGSKTNVINKFEGASVNGVNAIIMTHWLKREGLDWRVFVEWNKEEAFSEWYKVRFYLNGLLFVIGLFFLLGVVYGGRKLARPIYALRNALDDLVDKPLTFSSVKHEEKGISSDMLQKMEVIGDEVRNLHKEKVQLEKDLTVKNQELELVKNKVKEVVGSNGSLTNKNKVLSDNLVKEEKEITEHYKAVRRILKLQMYDSSLFSSPVENFFHIHNAKEEVSGDFVCTYERDSRVFFFLGDTGKTNIKAALARMVVTSIINEVVNVKRLASAGRIIEAINKSLLEITKKDEMVFDDGLKLSVCVWDRQKQMIEFSGANQSIFVNRDDVFEELNGDQVTLGINNNTQLISNIQYVPLNRVKGLSLYIFSDGLSNQLNKDNIPFTQERLKELLIDVQTEDLQLQKDYIGKTLIEWKGDQKQGDDVSILALKLI